MRPRRGRCESGRRFKGGWNYEHRNQPARAGSSDSKAAAKRCIRQCRRDHPSGSGNAGRAGSNGYRATKRLSLQRSSWQWRNSIGVRASSAISCMPGRKSAKRPSWLVAIPRMYEVFRAAIPERLMEEGTSEGCQIICSCVMRYGAASALWGELSAELGLPGYRFILQCYNLVILLDIRKGLRP